MKQCVDLYDIMINFDQFMLRAYLFEDGTLRLEGQDFSALSEEMFGSDEHEYFYDFDSLNVNKLKLLLHEEDIMVGLDKFFSKQMKNKEFFKLCDENHITYSYSSFR